jgi:hypothetical protein
MREIREGIGFEVKIGRHSGRLKKTRERTVEGEKSS